MTSEDSVSSTGILALGSEGERRRGGIAEEYVINIRIHIQYICGLVAYLFFTKPSTERSQRDFFTYGSSTTLSRSTEKILQCY